MELNGIKDYVVYGGRKFLVELSLFSMYDSRIELKINMENIKDSDTVINFIHDF